MSALHLEHGPVATILGRMDAAPVDALELLRDGHAEGRAVHGELDLDFDAYAQDVIGLVEGARRALDLDTTPLQLTAALQKRALADLYLARACEHGSDAAWARLVSSYEDRLVALARREGARGGIPERRATGLLSDLALAPASGVARTRMGTFAGLGALWPWLASQLVRSVWHDRRKTRKHADVQVVAPEEKRAPVWSDVLGREAGDALERAVTSAWAALPTRARLAFLLKYRHQLRQRRIAALLGVREYTISRDISAVVAAVKSEVEDGGGKAGAGGEDVWVHLRARLHSVLGRLDAAQTAERMAEDAEHESRG